MQNLNLIKYQLKEEEKLNVLIDYEKETVWLTTDQMALLFEKSKQNISKHISNIFKNNEANELSTVNYYLTVATNGKTYNIKHYNLEIVVLVGNKIDSLITKEFKEYIDNVIKEYKKTHKRYEIVKFIDNSVENRLELDVNVDPSEETVWLNLSQISLLFDRDKSVISRHISKIFEDKELEENSVVAFFATTETDGKTYNIRYFNLDVILSVGYRVNSKRGIVFRKWANGILKDYLIKGFSINTKRVLTNEESYNSLLNKVNDLTIHNTNITNQINDIHSNQISIDNRLKVVEDKITGHNLPIEKIIYQNEYYDAYALIQTIFEKANSEIIIIDNYIDRTILDRLVVKKSNVSVTIYTETSKSKVLPSDITNFNNQYGLLNVIDTKTVHDRYIIIDKSILYNIGGSIKDLGKKLTTLHLLDSTFIPVILKNI